METEYRQGFLYGSSSRSTEIHELATGDYDVAILSSSWDRRCLCITKAIGFHATHCGYFLLDLRDQFGLRDKHDILIAQFAAKLVGHPRVFTGGSHNVQFLWRQLLDFVIDAYNSVGRPLKLFIDLSTCPRFLSIGLTSNALLKGIASHVSVFYAEGHYPEESTEEAKHDLFTTGGWAAVAIPGLEGEWSPTKRRAYFVSVGFEGSKTLRLISLEEPDDVYVLFPDPGVKKEYIERAWQRNSTLLNSTAQL
jgi:hypothetical protein